MSDLIGGVNLENEDYIFYKHQSLQGEVGLVFPWEKGYVHAYL
jgi:hypothetical protein